MIGEGKNADAPGWDPTERARNRTARDGRNAAAAWDTFNFKGWAVTLMWIKFGPHFQQDQPGYEQP